LSRRHGAPDAAGPDDRPPARRRIAGRLAVAALVAVVLGALVWRQTDAGAIVAMSRGISPAWVLVTIAAFAAYQVARAARMRLMVDRKSPLRALTATMCLHALANNLLPAGLGEAVLVWLLRTRHGVRLSRGAGLLVLARMLDMLVFLLLFVGILAFAPDIVPPALWWVMAAVAALFAALAGGLTGLGLLRALTRGPDRVDPAGRIPTSDRSGSGPFPALRPPAPSPRRRSPRADRWHCHGRCLPP